MRNAFADEITKLAAADPSLVLFSGDIGNRMFEDFKAAAPGRFFNCGVAEANMVGMAAGLAMSGMRVVVYTITPFLTYRVIEQIRVDLCYHNVPVVLVGTGSGLSYASLGATHHSLEEIGMLRTLPGMTVLAPADAPELRACLVDALKLSGPVYMRIGKKGEPILHKSRPATAIGRSFHLREGTDLCLLGTGVMTATAVEAADLLGERGVKASVYSVPTIKPLDGHILADVFARYPLVVSVEEHGLIGGFGAAIAEWLADLPEPPKGRLLRCGSMDRFMHVAGETEYAREYFGLSAHQIVERIEARLARRPAELVKGYL